MAGESTGTILGNRHSISGSGPGFLAVIGGMARLSGFAARGRGSAALVTVRGR